MHIFGHPADMRAIRSLAEAHGLAVVEDAAQAFARARPTAKVGTLGDAATFSFFPTKNFPGMGAAAWSSAATRRWRSASAGLRFHGSADKVVFDEVGYNSRLDDLQAAIIRVFYPHLDGWNAPRRGRRLVRRRRPRRPR